MCAETSEVQGATLSIITFFSFEVLVSLDSLISCSFFQLTTSQQISHSLSDLRDIPSEGRIVEPDEAPLMQMAARGHGYPETYLALRKKPNDYR